MLEGWSEEVFENRSIARRYFVKGDGRGVILMHEISGISKPCIELGELLVADGFRVWMPYLFETPGEIGSPPSGGMKMVRACLSSEIVWWLTGRTSPITAWLRAFAAHVHEADDGAIGVIGMCLSGGFVLAMAIDPIVAAPVVSQPALPLGVFRYQRQDLGLSPCHRDELRDRMASDDAGVLGFRFKRDLLAPHRRFDQLKAVLGDNFERFELPTIEGPRFGRFAHSVLATEPYKRKGPSKEHDDLALATERLISFLRDRLPPLV